MRSFSRESRKHGGELEINLAPLMDMVFILLIFFVVTTVFVDETGVEVKKPSAASAEKLEKNSILIAITEAGKIVYGGEEYTLNGVRGIVSRELGRKDMPVIIFVDASAESGLLVDVIDECKLAGAKKVSVATKRES